MNEHVTSDGFTFSQHMHLAALWCRWNGTKGTERQAVRAMDRHSAPVLLRMLTARGVVVPAHCAAPVVAS